MPAIGTKAPSFTGVDKDGKKVKLSDFKDRKLALYFYPKDDTSGCTKQACNLRDNYAGLKEAGISIVGVSKDSMASHVKFADKYDLPFPLIADEDLSIHHLYGTYGEKNMYGRKSMGVKRTTFLINEMGLILDIIKRPKTGDHTAEILRRFD
ncbi:MAG: thioredoxin-dependent thiol peroxidase [Rhodothermales bacterium]|nr:thioredoxin-dependent thiol peroxidase [Rhodothermales bacterium]